MNRFSVSILLVVLWTFLGCGPEPESITIGAVFPESGFAEYLFPVRLGIDMALERVNGSDYLGGKTLEIVYVDSQSQAQHGANMAENLLKDLEPDLLITVLSNVSNASAFLGPKYEMPIMTLVASDPTVTTHNEYMFSYYFTAENEVAPMRTILRENQIKSLGVLYQDEAYGQSVYREITKHQSSDNYTITPSSFTPGQEDLSSPVERVLETEAVVIVGFEQICIDALKMLKEKNYQGIIIGTSTLSSEVFRALEEAQGIYVSGPLVYNPNYQLIQDVSQQFKAQFGIDLHHNAATGYDVIYLIAGLLKNETNITPELIHEKLLSEFIFPGVSGNIMKEEGAQGIQIPLYPAQILNNQLVF